MNQLLGGNECERAHTLTTTTTGSKNSQKEANNQTSNQNSVLCPPKVPSLQILGLVTEIHPRLRYVARMERERW